MVLAIAFSVIEVPIPAPKSSTFITADFVSDNSSILGVVAYNRDTNQSFTIGPSRLLVAEVNSEIKATEMARSVFLDAATFEIGGSKYTMTSVHIEAPVQGEWYLIPYLYTWDERHVPLNDKDRPSIGLRWRTERQEYSCAIAADNKNLLERKPSSMLAADDGESAVHEETCERSFVQIVI